MILTKPSFEILTELDGEKILKNIEKAGRTAYKSEDKISKDSAKEFVKMLVKRRHLSVIEHESFSVKFIVDRGISHELVRHRLASFTQESTRYCNYSKDKFQNQLSVIDMKQYLTEKQYQLWRYLMILSENVYFDLLKNGATPQLARSVLPNSLKTEIVVTANLREWRTIFKQRTSKSAHPQMRDIMKPLLNDVRLKVPIIFDDILL